MTNLPSFDDVNAIVSNLRSYFNSGVTRPIKWRLNQLNGLIRCLSENEDAWVNALKEDLGRPRFETLIMISNIISDVKFTISNLDKWMRPKGLSTPMILQPGSTHLTPEPYGVVADFLPFNYPMFLGITTMVPIYAAGNVCLLKPSSNTPATGQVFEDLLPKYLDPQGIFVFRGPTQVCDTILLCRFDFIFYTGSPRIGKSVQKAASNYLTPVFIRIGREKSCLC